MSTTAPVRHRTPRLRPWAALLALVVLVASVLAACNASDGRPDSASAAVAAPAVAPGLNTVVVMVDDLNDFSCADTRRYLPRSSRWLLARGTCYANATVTDPVCCPARGTLMTGQVPHHSGVFRQIDARRLRVRDTVQHALTDRGLATYGTGKLVNGVNARDYRTGAFRTGFESFDFWNTYNYFKYKLVDEDGHLYHPEPRLHTTVRTGANLREFIVDAATAGRPFYAYAGFFAPHTQQQREGRDRSKWPVPTVGNRYRPVPPLRYRPERDLRDKLPIFRQKLHGRSYLKAFHAARVRSVYDVDDQVAATFETLEDLGIADTTAVFFVSDNGYALGSNGWEGKAVPYPDSVKVPMLAYLPGVFRAGAVDRRQVGIVDIAPTIYDLYDLAPGHRLDGHSLLRRHRRTGQFHEFRNERNGLVRRESGHAPITVPTWAMYTRGNRAYIEYYNSRGRIVFREFYKDAARHRNLLARQYRHLAPAPGTIKRYQKTLHRLRRCEGTRESGARNPCP